MDIDLNDYDDAAREIPFWLVEYLLPSYQDMGDYVGYAFSHTIIYREGNINHFFRPKAEVEKILMQVQTGLQKHQEHYLAAFKQLTAVEARLRDLMNGDCKKLFTELQTALREYWGLYVGCAYIVHGLGDVFSSLDQDLKDAMAHYKRTAFWSDLWEHAQQALQSEEFSSDLNGMTCQEIVSALEKQDYDKELLKERLSVFYDTREKKILLGKEARDRYESIRVELEVDAVDQLKGRGVTQGTVRGPVRVVLSSDSFAAFKEGEILVARMTSPYYTPIMKKAAAIVTDEGGMASHAAIIARELAKVCLVGTEKATRVFKDGDVVEVDAEKGIIKKVHSS